MLLALARVVLDPADLFYGERSCVVLHPVGHRRTIGHGIEDVTSQEMQARYDTGGDRRA